MHRAQRDNTRSQTRIFLYGPPGSGKSLIGRRLAEDLGLPFRDLDREIEFGSGNKIADIFEQQGENAFRRIERESLEATIAGGGAVISLGGGALLDAGSRTLAEGAGQVVCLEAPLEVLVERLSASPEERPLLQGDLRSRLEVLIENRTDHYASFPLRVDTTQISPDQVSWELQVLLGKYTVRGMGAGYRVQVSAGGLEDLSQEMLSCGMRGPVLVVSDENVAPIYSEQVKENLERVGLEIHIAVITAGESSKTLETIDKLWQALTEAQLERSSSVVALGGGVVGDLAGFAAATYMRGMPWVVVPTSLLAMVDASLGGKTGFDLPSGKNLVGAFHPPSLVLTDVNTLDTLPIAELRSGMAEVVKHGVVGDPELFTRCAAGWGVVRDELESVVRRAVAVKVRVIQSDPYEQGERETLNLGHTIGHALEQASGYRLRHGEAVAAGMVAEARLSERIGIAEDGLADRIAAALHELGLPTEIPSQLERSQIIQAMGVDKKRARGQVRFSLPVRIGEVRVGVTVDDLSMIYQGEL